MTTLIIDGSSLLKYSFYGAKDVEGGGVYQFLNHIRKYVKDYFIDKVIVCWDMSLSGKLKSNIYPNYKIRRKNWETGERIKPKPEDEIIDQQKLQLRKICFHLGFYQLYDDVTEADDIMAYYVQNSTDKKHYIVTGDSDILQLISDKTQILYLHKNKNKKQLYNHITFKKIFDYSHKNMAFIKAIVGDSSDDVIGCKGLGMKKLTENFNLKNDLTKEILLSTDDDKLNTYVNSELFETTLSIVNLSVPILSDEVRIKIDKCIQHYFPAKNKRNNKELLSILDQANLKQNIITTSNLGFSTVKTYKSFFSVFHKMFK